MYEQVRNNSYINISDTLSLGQNMILFLGILGFIVLVIAAMLVVLHHVDNLEDIERKELQKLVNEIID